MNNSAITIFLIISFITIGIDTLVAIKSLEKNTELGMTLGHTVICATIVCATYFMSVMSTDHIFFAIWSSIYFVAIDWMLVFMVSFTIHYTRMSDGKLQLVNKILAAYAFIESIAFAINPLNEIIIGYHSIDNPIVHFEYQQHGLYTLHLIFTYGMVVMVLYIMVKKAFSVPKQYRKRFLYVTVSILIVVGINAIFLFIQSNSILSYLDCSVFSYSCVVVLLYWFTFSYSTKNMLESLSMTVFGNLDQGIILFDYDGIIVLKNTKVDEFFAPNITIDDGITIREFFEKSDINIDLDDMEDNCSLQCYINKGVHKNPVRCDYTCMRDEHGYLVSYLLVFTDLEMETDLLTEFHNWEHFNHYASKNKDSFEYPMGVVAFDINNLGVINSSYGKEAGDSKLASLALTMRESFNKETYFVRREACLFALSYNPDKAYLLNCAEEVEERYDGSIQYASAVTDRSRPDIVDAIEEAYKALRTKKLLDRDSNRSQVLTSLLRALQESDGDTEAHVQRTQQMGRELGNRIGLNDSKQSDLSLLCLLHDIGKIGIPLEILNKPGKLTEDEWRVLKTHTEKGYQIAMSSREFSHIADEILHHHERWDGKGYPSGLSRESIPLLSRIISVIDAYDAMINDRPYRKKLSLAAAVEELKTNAGTQFDPHITSQFIQMLVEQEGINPSTILDVDSDEYTIKPINVSVPTADRIEKNSHAVIYTKYTLDENDVIVEVDDNFELITGYTREDIQINNYTQADLIPEEDKSEYFILVEKQLAANALAFIEHRIVKKNGGIEYVFCYGRRYYDSANKEGRSEIILSKVSDTYAIKTIAEVEDMKARKRLEQWENTYRRDALTGLLNHLAFQNDIEQKLLEEDFKILFLMIDVDNFKSYNDTYGHKAGDEYLITVANTIKAALREKDLACRIGGDEFACALFFKQEHSNDFMYHRAQQIFDKINLSLSTVEMHTSLSMGAEISSPDVNTFVKLYQSADKKLYESKNKGKGRLTVEIEGE